MAALRLAATRRQKPRHRARWRPLLELVLILANVQGSGRRLAVQPSPQTGGLQVLAA